MRAAIVNGRVLLPDGSLEDAAVLMEDGVITALADGPPANGGHRQVLDAEGALVLPGMVDLHGDAFERQLLPRPATPFPTDVALIETDRQLVANGITTAFYGVTDSWEPGLRGEAQVVALVDAVHALRPTLSCDTRIHLRWETYNLAGEVRVAEWLRNARIDLLAFNDHFLEISRRADQPEKLAAYLNRTNLSADVFRGLVRETEARGNEVPGAVARLARTAQEHGVPMASHDDDTPETRRHYNELGCRICEFPLDAATAEASRRMGDPIILGGPNVVRDGSHCDRLHAATAVADGYCDILTSDYYYPSMLHAVFILTERGYADLATAWRLVSTAPARAAGLVDRGEIAAGKRADVVVVDDWNPALPRVRATFAAGRPVHRSVRASG